MAHIYWFAYYDLRSPSTRYRGKYLLEALHERQGITSSLVTTGYQPRQVFLFFRTFLRALFFPGKNSLIVFQKIYSRGLYAHSLQLLARVHGRRSFYDWDDAEHIRFPPGTILNFLGKVQVVVAGSEKLAEFSGKFAQEVRLLPSPIRKRHPRRTRPDYGQTPLKLGWIGFFNAHRESLFAQFFPALRFLDFPVILTLVGVDRPEQEGEVRSFFSNLPHVSIRFFQPENWTQEEEVYQEIETWDWGISTLRDNEFDQSKSAFKLKQYFSCGVPSLASPIGENLNVLVEGETGFFCRNAQEFQESLEKARAMSGVEYKRFSEAAFRRSEEFSLENFSRNWAELIRSQIGRD